MTFDATLLAGETLRTGVILAAAPVNLPDLVVEAEGRMYFGKMMGFADRMLHSGAPRRSFLTQADIDHLGFTKTIDLVMHAGLTHRYAAEGKDDVTCPRGYSFKSAAERPAQYNATGSDCTVVIWTK